MTTEPSTEYEAEESAQAAPATESVVEPVTPDVSTAPVEEPQAADEPVAAPEPVVEVEPETVTAENVAAAVDAVEAETPSDNYEGESFVITTNSGRTRITVVLDPDEYTPDADGTPRLVRTGSGNLTVTRDGQTVLAHPLMREAPLE